MLGGVPARGSTSPPMAKRAQVRESVTSRDSAWSQRLSRNLVATCRRGVLHRQVVSISTLALRDHYQGHRHLVISFERSQLTFLRKRQHLYRLTAPLGEDQQIPLHTPYCAQNLEAVPIALAARLPCAQV